MAMKRGNNQSFVKRVFQSRFFITGAILVFILVASAYGRAFYQDYKIKQEIAQLETELQNLQVERLELLDVLNRAMSDDYVDEVARTQLNMKKPGEHVIVVNRHEESDSTRRSGQIQEEALSNPIKWWYYITHKKT